METRSRTQKKLAIWQTENKNRNKLDSLRINETKITEYDPIRMNIKYFFQIQQWTVSMEIVIKAGHLKHKTSVIQRNEDKEKKR